MAFESNFRRPFAAKLLIESAEDRQMKKSYDLLCHHDDFGGDQAPVPAEVEKVRYMLSIFCLSRFLTVDLVLIRRLKAKFHYAS